MFEDLAEANWLVIGGMYLIVLLMIWKGIAGDFSMAGEVSGAGSSKLWQYKVTASILMLPLIYVIVEKIGSR